MITYTRHRCERTHRDSRTWAHCAWPRANWITGRGEYASVSYCRGTTVMLWPTPEQAQQAVDAMYGACGGACTNQHRAIHINLGRQTLAQTRSAA